MADPVPLPWWKFFRALAPAVLFWAALVAWLAYLLGERTDQGAESDEAIMREWIDEGRSFRKTLPEPVRKYQGQLPAFPEVYRLEVAFPGRPDTVVPIAWDSPAPRPREQNRTHVRSLE